MTDIDSQDATGQTLDRTPGRTCLALPARLDTRAAASLTGALRAARGADLDLDGGACTMIGALGLQTLMVAAATWRHDGRAFRVHELPADTAGQIVMMGIDPDHFLAPAA
ncbi:STAS domain-containing protein [Palleronia sp. KMU-117]|uniref:STAS domain-containing protein n=1 Tax=Palleronia sp. KMU-117 TaxID=3434108 RepID=UPI003D708B5A